MKVSLRTGVSVLLAATVLCTSAQAITLKQAFPRLGGYRIGKPQDYDHPAYQKQIAKYDILILDFYPGWRGGNATKMAAVVDAIRALNPNIIIVDYHNYIDMHDTGKAWHAYRAKLNASNWWLRTSGLTGPRILSAYGKKTGGPYYMTNYSDFVAPDAQGKRWNTWVANRIYLDGLAKAPNLDGTFTDNMNVSPRAVSNGDWNLDGVPDPTSSDITKKWHAAGMMKVVDELSRLAPGKLNMANVASWGKHAGLHTGWDGKLDGGLLEGAIGETWSPEGQKRNWGVNIWGSWQTMMSWYRTVLSKMNGNKLVILQQHGDSANYQSMRYGLASTLMDDGYYDFKDRNNHTVHWFDEYDLAGTGTTGWLGTAIDPPQTRAWQKGVYRRRFRNGVVLINPRGNGVQTVTIEPGYRRIKGIQDAVTNNGQPVAKLTLQDRDGVLLVAAPVIPVPVQK